MATQKAPAGFALPVINNEARAEAFGYTCNRCLSCCKNMDVPVDPYESARLARHLGISTSQFRQEFTRDNLGNMLAHQENSDCVFLGENGCTVYSDRPLACRLYPLCREITPGDEEIFTHLEPKPTTAGLYSQNGTIEDYLAKQDIAPYVLASDEYYVWYCLAVESLEENGIDAPDNAGNSPLGPDLLDMDTAVAAYCVKKRIPEPCDIEERKAIHLLTLHDSLKPSNERTK
jgi:Fe-S-cluster containining protein